MIDEKLIKFLKEVEGVHGDKGKDVEGDGILTFGYGHKNYDKKDFSGYTQEMYDSLLVDDLNKAEGRARQQFTNMFNESDEGLDYSTNYETYDTLSNDAKAILIDFAYNVGNVRTYPKLSEAILNNDWDTISKEYERPNLGQRNDILYESYIAPNMVNNKVFNAVQDSTATPNLDIIQESIQNK